MALRGFKPFGFLTCMAAMHDTYKDRQAGRQQSLGVFTTDSGCRQQTMEQNRQITKTRVH